MTVSSGEEAYTHSRVLWGRIGPFVLSGTARRGSVRLGYVPRSFSVVDLRRTYYLPTMATGYHTKRGSATVFLQSLLLLLLLSFPNATRGSVEVGQWPPDLVNDGQPKRVGRVSRPSRANQNGLQKIGVRTTVVWQRVERTATICESSALRPALLKRYSSTRDQTNESTAPPTTSTSIRRKVVVVLVVVVVIVFCSCC